MIDGTEGLRKLEKLDTAGDRPETEPMQKRRKGPR